MKDLVLVTVPYTESDFPLAALGILKAVAQSVGWTCKAYDFNIEVYNEIESSPKRDQDHLVDWFFSERYYPEIADQIAAMFERASDEIAKYNPKIVGFSLFTSDCQVAAKYLSIKIREKCPNAKIVFGGSGIYDDVEGDQSYINNMMAMGLVDHYIRGDAEVSFAEFLKGNTKTVGVDTAEWNELSNETLKMVPYADYSDLDWSQYQRPAIPMVGSRGCVRNCTFCNYIVFWSKFTSRPGHDIFQEMLHQKQKHGHNLFVFTDTLINGNLREFKVLMKLMADYNDQHPDDKMTWNGHFIFRPKHQFNADDWTLLAKSNPEELYVGIESLSERIRYDMGKKFNQADMEFNLDQAMIHNIKISGMLIVGYPTEDRFDIDYAKDWLTNNQHYKKVMRLQWGGTMSILPGSILDREREKYGLEIYGPPWQHWISNITGSTPRLRVEWLKELSDHSEELGFRISRQVGNESIVNTLLTYEHLQPLQPWVNDRASDLERFNDL